MNTLLTISRAELLRIFQLKPVFSVMVLGVLIYALLYPQPYLNEVLRDIPVVLVDLDGTASSQELARRIDATPDVQVAFTSADFSGAQPLIYNRHAYGILLIPKEFERNLLHGGGSAIALFADASYFLLFQSISGGVAISARTMGAEIEIARLAATGVDPIVAAAATDPLPFVQVPLFNPQGGYASYILPAAFVLILQQTLLMGVGLLGSLTPTAIQSPSGSFLETVIGKLLAYLLLELVLVLFYLVVLIQFYDIPRLGSVVNILILAIPFILSVSSLGMLVAELIRNAQTVQLVLSVVGLPFFFLAGFAWPMEDMPAFIQYMAQLVPSTAAIPAFVAISQMGAELSDVSTLMLQLWGLTLLYVGWTILLTKRRFTMMSAALGTGMPKG